MLAIYPAHLIFLDFIILTVKSKNYETFVLYSFLSLPNFQLQVFSSVPSSQTPSVYVKFEVFIAVTMKNTVFWDVAPCRSCLNRCFGGTCRLHLQGTKIHERVTSVSRWIADCCMCIKAVSSLNALISYHQ
jgi:hypothetical protein